MVFDAYSHGTTRTCRCCRHPATCILPASPPKATVKRRGTLLQWYRMPLIAAATLHIDPLQFVISKSRCSFMHPARPLQQPSNQIQRNLLPVSSLQLGQCSATDVLASHLAFPALHVLAPHLCPSHFTLAFPANRRPTPSRYTPSQSTRGWSTVCRSPVSSR